VQGSRQQRNNRKGKSNTLHSGISFPQILFLSRAAHCPRACRGGLLGKGNGPAHCGAAYPGCAPIGRAPQTLLHLHGNW
jgi:hypothetical protein